MQHDSTLGCEDVMGCEDVVGAHTMSHPRRPDCENLKCHSP
jgi:hypothetical protein